MQYSKIHVIGIKEKREQVEDTVEQAMAEDFPKLINIGIQVSESLVSIIMGMLPRSGIPGPYGNSLTLRTVPTVASPFFMPTSNAHSSFFTFSSTHFPF